MRILSHRGFWAAPSEKNQALAFERSFSAGFGTETDVRDCQGRLVISHDPPTGEELDLDGVLDLLGAHRLPLAVNIKADGLAASLHGTFARRPEVDWFAFDMSVPDMRAHLKVGNPVFARLSEVEREPPWFDQLAGIWLDGFEGHWYDDQLILNLTRQGKRVCIVSPELHGRANADLWSRLRPLAGMPQLMLCTDQPEDARRYFSEC
jgi:glycerophosphoryl diester phosphodiesterase